MKKIKNLMNPRTYDPETDNTWWMDHEGDFHMILLLSWPLICIGICKLLQFVQFVYQSF